MKKVSIVMIALMAIGMMSCQPTKTMVDTSCPGYRSNNFTRDYIASGKMGIMPVLGGAEREQFRRPMADKLHQHFSQTFGRENVYSAQQVVQVLNEYKLAEDYSRAIENYRVSGIIPRELVKQMGDALGVEYLLYTSLLGSSEVDFITIGNSYQKIQTDEVYIQSQVWSTTIGDVVWEGKGGIAKLKNYEGDMVDLTARGLAQVIGNDAQQGPCEEPSALFRSAQEAAGNTYLAVMLVSLLAIIPILYL